MAKAVKTINGWPVLSGTSKMLKDFAIPGTKRKIKLRADVGAYLVAFASEYHQIIAPIDTGKLDDWGWAPLRDGRFSSSPSDHCAGVAIDLNATGEGAASRSNVWWVKHPLKALALRRLLKKYSLLQWGGDYRKHYDPMHFAISVPSVTAVKAEIKKLGITPTGRIK